MKHKNILKWILPVLCVVGLSSCLKNKNEQPDFSSGTPVIEFPVNTPKGDGSPNSLTATVSQQAEPVDYFYMVNYAAAEANASDVKVTYAVDQALLAKYNAANPGDVLTMLPAANYTMPLTVTIPAGQRKVQIPVKIITSSLRVDTKYAIPVTIADASGVTLSKNFTSVVIRVLVKNKYDGVYSVTGNIVRQGDTDGLQGPVKAGVTTQVITDGENDNQFTVYWANGGGVAGIDETGLHVDPVTNKVTVYSKKNAALVNLAGFDNSYDPASKTFHLSFYWGNGPAHRAATIDLKYIGARN